MLTGFVRSLILAGGGIQEVVRQLTEYEPACRSEARQHRVGDRPLAAVKRVSRATPWGARQGGATSEWV